MTFWKFCHMSEQFLFSQKLSYIFTALPLHTTTTDTENIRGGFTIWKIMILSTC